MTLPTLSLAQRHVLDRLLVEAYGITLAQQQEMAGAAAAELAREAFLKGQVLDKGVVVLAGSGFKGAVALACARRLHTWGARVRVCHAHLPPQSTPQTQGQLHTLQRMSVIALEKPAHNALLVIDGLLDAGESARDQARSAELIGWANTQIHPVLAIDIPSGVHPDTGTPMHAPVMRASATLALALPLAGLLTDKARPQVGELYLADLSVPRTAYAAPGLGFELGYPFGESAILKLR